MVSRLGHEVIEAGGGALGLEKIGETNPDCIICDLLMPEVSGFMVLEELQKKGNTIPVIILTADIQDSVRETCLSLGARVVLNKPPKDVILGEAINNYLNL
ncbi:MAG: response regulator [Prolixibacteraceae bacterium]|jgi:CheY-like chemotaxis protein|nr:response regulator [Prolixibacteraceae bacterium]MBT6005168.1 response regulator [Prolixibacteraceae bacterium]MBT7000628.1 response regulator [Prolixibacteraceae bacterium]MBT7396203.1 response regulator [Prolixibacteraceae bacterium]